MWTPGGGEPEPEWGVSLRWDGWKPGSTWNQSRDARRPRLPGAELLARALTRGPTQVPPATDAEQRRRLP